MGVLAGVVDILQSASSYQHTADLHFQPNCIIDFLHFWANT